MNDEHFMRQWNDGHSAFSADADRKLSALARHLSRRDRLFFGIGETYGSEHPGRDRMRPILSGIAACIATTTLFLTVGALALPGPVLV